MTVSTVPWERAALSVAEIKTLRLVLEGHEPKRIALIRGVGLATVRTQLKRMRDKTKSKSTLQIALWALKARNWE